MTDDPREWIYHTVPGAPCDAFALPLTKEAAIARGTVLDTHPAVIMAIHAVARITAAIRDETPRDSRTPDQIWEAPTVPEFWSILHILRAYQDAGVFPEPADGQYRWGTYNIRSA